MIGRQPDPYETLGVTPDATGIEIATAFRSLARRHHPDTRDDDGAPADPTALQQIIAAYDMLRDPSLRSEYDNRAAASRDARPNRRLVSGPSPIRAGPVRRQPSRR